MNNSAPLFAIFDASDEDSLVQSNYATYDEADQVAAELRAQGYHGVFACEVCAEHEDEPAGYCVRCGDGDDTGE